jgi:hypothetical protein
MKGAALLLGVLASLSAASDELPVSPQVPSVQILGVTIVRGMPETEVRAALPMVYCAEKAPGTDPTFDYCSVSDDVPPGADGEITFKDGLVHTATRNWFIPEGAAPLDVLTMSNDMLTPLTGEVHAVCAKIETYRGQEPTYTHFDLPEKVLTVQMHTIPGRSGAYFKESLRVNPVPDMYRTRGHKMQGTEWCGYVN